MDFIYSGVGVRDRGLEIVARSRDAQHAAARGFNSLFAELGSSLKELCAGIPGLFLTGNYLSGPSLPTCVEHARVVADVVKDFIGAQG